MMNDQDRQYRIARAKEVLSDIHHIPVATVNKDGSPHASPVFLAFDSSLHGFWVSSPTSLHSQNINRDPRVFLSIFNSRDGHSGLFLAGVAVELTDRQAITVGLEQLRTLKEKLHGDIGGIADYMGVAGQRIYKFTPGHAWVNHSEKRDDVIVRDERYEIALRDLTANQMY